MRSIATTRNLTTLFQAADASSGEDARLYGGRWNSPGIAMVYTAGSVSLATLELLVHLGNTSLLPSFSTCPVDFDDSLVELLDLATLPPDWNQSPAPTSLQPIGDDWISRASSVVLRVPSAVIANKHNYLINPAHTDFEKLAIGSMEALKLDPRLTS